MKQNDVMMDQVIMNQWIMSYNQYPLHQIDCNINVEICSSIKCVKYVIKYVHNGTDPTAIDKGWLAKSEWDWQEPAAAMLPGGSHSSEYISIGLLLCSWLSTLRIAMGALPCRKCHVTFCSISNSNNSISILQVVQTGWLCPGTEIRRTAIVLHLQKGKGKWTRYKRGTPLHGK